MKLRIDSLLLLVAAAGYIATSGAHIDPVRFGLLMLAGFLGAAGASATNHYLDRDLDLVMHRTSTRPLPQRRIEPPAHALEFRRGLVVAGRVVAAVGINLLTAATVGLGNALYLGVAVFPGAILLGFAAKFLASPSDETAWAGYKFSGLYLALLLFGAMDDAIVRIPV